MELLHARSTLAFDMVLVVFDINSFKGPDSQCLHLSVALKSADHRQQKLCISWKDLTDPAVLVQGASKAKDFTETLARGPRESLVALRTEGQFVGEMGLFTTACIRCASVRAKGPVTVKVISGDRLQDCIDRNPEVGMAWGQ